MQATVEDDLPELERAVRVLAKALPDEDATSQAAPGEEPPANPPSEA